MAGYQYTDQYTEGGGCCYVWVGEHRCVEGGLYLLHDGNSHLGNGQRLDVELLGCNGCNHRCLVDSVCGNQSHYNLSYLLVVGDYLLCHVDAAYDDSFLGFAYVVEHVLPGSFKVGYRSLQGLALCFEHSVELTSLAGCCVERILHHLGGDCAFLHFLLQLSDALSCLLANHLQWVEACINHLQ